MVETWMTNVEAEMRRTLRTIAKEAVFYYPKTPRIKWIMQYPGKTHMLRLIIGTNSF